MNRSPLLALAAGLTLAVVAPAQEPSPADEAYSQLEAKILEVQRAPASVRAKKYEELFAECGAFLDAHAQAASEEQLTKAGGLWLMLAERLRQPEQAIRARLEALRARAPSDELRRIMQRVEAKLGLKAGSPAPAWAGTDVVDGEAVSLEGLRGKLVLMTFWAFVVAQSVDLLQGRVAALHRRHQGDGLVVVSVGVPSGGDSAAAEKALAEELGWTWRKVFDAPGEVAQAYGVDGVPYVALIDAEGKLLAIGPAQTVMAPIERALAERFGGQGR